MSIEIYVPDIGGDEVAVTEILVKVGDTVDADDSALVAQAIAKFGIDADKINPLYA